MTGGQWGRSKDTTTLLSDGNPFKETSINFTWFGPFSAFSMVMQEVGRWFLTFLQFITCRYLKNEIFYRKSLITRVSHQMVKLTVKSSKKPSYKLSEQYPPIAFYCCSSFKFATWHYLSKAKTVISQNQNQKPNQL